MLYFDEGVTGNTRNVTAEMKYKSIVAFGQWSHSGDYARRFIGTAREIGQTYLLHVPGISGAFTPREKSFWGEKHVNEVHKQHPSIQ